MFIFIRLLAAHLIADFFLQTDRVYQIKVRYKWGVLLHGGIVGLVTALALLPFFRYWLIAVLFILGFALHIFQDKAKILYNHRAVNNNLTTFLLDQLLHIFVLGVISFGALNLENPGFPGPVFLADLYANTGIFVFIIWILFVSYTTSIMQVYIKKAITGDKIEKLQWPGAPQKYIEMAWRITIAVFIFLGGLWNSGAVAAVLTGYYLVKIKKIPVLNFQIGAALAVLTGFLMKFTIR